MTSVPEIEWGRDGARPSTNYEMHLLVSSDRVAKFRQRASA